MVSSQQRVRAQRNPAVSWQLALSGLVRRLSLPGNRRWVWAVLIMAGSELRAFTLDDLMKDEALTPKRFASRFSTFDYAFHARVQDPTVFLATESGDCDDYAILAATVLGKKGYSTHLIMVRMPGLVPHVICYVTEEKGYLDYNNRVYMSKIQRCAPTLRAIAGKVAKSFDANWTSASEFRFEQGRNWMLSTVVRTETSDQDPPLGGKTP